MQRGEPAAGGERQRKPYAAHPERAAIDRLAAGPLPVEHPAREAEHHRKQERGRPEQHEEQVRQPGAERPDQVRDRPILSGGRKRRVGPVVARQRNEQDQRERAEDPQRTFPQAARDDGGLHRRAAFCFCSSHQ
jgi:hypothetical protein